MLFNTARQADVTAAQLLPDEQQRGEAAETARVLLADQTLLCLSTWQKLKRYIADAWPANLQKAKTEAAGQDYYAGAANNNWDEVQGLMTSGLTFITDNTVALTAGMNMPATFQADFTTARDDFNAMHQDFLDKEEAAMVATEEKQTANNNIYAALISMFLDGQEIYKNQEALQKLFIFEQVLSLVSGPGLAGIKGTITDNTPGHLPIPNVNITLLENGNTALSGADGKYQLTPITAGTHQISFQAVGFQPVILPAQQVLVGTVSTVNITMIQI